MDRSLFRGINHSQDDLELREEFKGILGEPDNILKSMAKGFFFRWVKREKNWHDRIE